MFFKYSGMKHCVEMPSSKHIVFMVVKEHSTVHGYIITLMFGGRLDKWDD